MDILCEDILDLPEPLTDGIQTKEACVQLYLQTSPYASREHLAGRLFVYGDTIALEKVKKRMKPVRGQYNYVRTLHARSNQISGGPARKWVWLIGGGDLKNL